MKMLDAGAQGTIVPMIGTAEQAREAVLAVNHPPLGSRSWGPIRASLDLPGYNPQVANDQTVVAVMIETVEGVKNMDEIMAVEGVDATYVGPSDLGLTHGMTTTQSPEPGSAHEGLILDILAGCERNNVVPGIHTDSVETAMRRREAGFRMITIMSEALLLRRAATEAITSMRGEVRPLLASGPGSSYV